MGGGESSERERERHLTAVRLNGYALQYVPEMYKADRHIVLSAVRRNGRALEFASPSLRGDRAIVLAAVEGNAEAIRYAAQTLQGDRQLVLVAVQANGATLRYAAEELKADRETVRAAVQQTGSVLECAAGELRGDREIVMAAVQQNGCAVMHAAEDLRGDREIVLAAVQQHGCALAYAAEELRGDREIVLAAVQQNVRALPIAAKALLLDSAFATEAKKTYFILKVSLLSGRCTCQAVDVDSDCTANDVLRFCCQALALRRRGTEVLINGAVEVPAEVVQIELSCWTSSSGCKATSSLWKGLASLSQLRKVSLHAVQVSHADEAAEALKAHPGLTELRLAFAGLDDLKFTDERRRVEEPGVEPIHPLQKFANALGAQPYPKLALLSLEGNSIGEEGGKKVAEALHRLPSLRQLHLLDIGEEGANAVARALMPLQNLSVLSVHASIEHWEMGAFRIISCWGFAQALADKKQLLSLAFNGHQIGADCVDALSKKVLRSQRLTDLNLKDNNISSRGVSILGELIESGNGLKKLRTLDVTANSIMSEGATAIAKALLALRSLEVVHLDDNDIEDEGCRELASALRKLKMMPPFQVKLKELTFAENPCLSGEAGEELQEAWDAFQRRALPGSKIPKPGKRGPRRPAGDGQKGLIVPGRLFPMFREPEIPGAEEMSVGEADDWDESWA